MHAFFGIAKRIEGKCRLMHAILHFRFKYRERVHQGADGLRRRCYFGMNRRNKAIAQATSEIMRTAHGISA